VRSIDPRAASRPVIALLLWPGPRRGQADDAVHVLSACVYPLSPALSAPDRSELTMLCLSSQPDDAVHVLSACACPLSLVLSACPLSPRPVRADDAVHVLSAPCQVRQRPLNRQTPRFPFQPSKRGITSTLFFSIVVKKELNIEGALKVQVGKLLHLLWPKGRSAVAAT
jgi:hypothetical protein